MTYELLDSGQGINSVGEKYGEKLERFGDLVIRRPDPEVLWDKKRPEEVWNSADATFVVHGLSKKWQIKENTAGSTKNTTGYSVENPQKWIAEIGGLKFNLTLGAFKHVGIFPEQVAQWDWMVEKVSSAIVKNALTKNNQKIKVLNLFGYTGGASCALAKAGADVTHVDALESNISRTKENLTLNGLANEEGATSVRLIVDDARKFVEREIRRGAKYDAIIMDPPVYGKGDKNRSKKSEWQIENDLLPLLSRAKELLSDTPLFWIISGYASEYSPLSYANALGDVLISTKYPNIVTESGELTIKESETDRLLPAGIFARAVF